MKIAIVDDEQIYRDNIKELILEYNSQFMVDIFQSSEEFLLSNVDEYSILFVDIEMQGIDGITLANDIKQKNRDILIFFATSYTSYITSALRTMPFQYLVKPIDKQIFMEEFDRAINFLAKRETLFTVKTLKGPQQVKVGDISYIEYLNRKIEIHTTEKIIYTYGTIKDIWAKLIDYDFIKCHASFIINLAAIKSIKGYDMILKNGDIIPISKKELLATREMYARYIAREIV